MIVKREFYKLKTKKFEKSRNSESKDFDVEFYNNTENYNYKADNDHELHLTEGMNQICKEDSDDYIAKDEFEYFEKNLFMRKL